MRLRQAAARPDARHGASVCVRAHSLSCARALTVLCDDRLLCRQLGRAFREASKAHETAQLLEPMRSVLSVARNLKDERMMELAEQFLLQATSGR